MSSAFEGLPKTPNLKLNKPGYDNVADIEALNENSDILDDEINTIKSNLKNKGSATEPIYFDGNGVPQKTKNFTDYLPLAGGIMTGTIKFNTSEKYQINMTTDDKYIHISGGTNVDDGAVLALYGQNLSSEYNGTAGGFTLQTKKIDNDANGLGYYALEGTPAGNLTWKQKVVETINNKTTNVIRYENGLQIIFASCSYTNDSTPITLPLPFVNGNYSVIPIAVNANGYGIIVGKNTTSFRITTRQATSPTTALPSGSIFSYIAIGYWK